MSKKNRAAPLTIAGAVAALGVAMTVSLVAVGSETALADGGFDLTATEPTPVHTNPIPSVHPGPQKRTGTQATPRSTRKNWNANSDLPTAANPYPDFDSSAGSSNS